ncbi:MAG TPA: DUF4118 domain-containing protein, partial [Pirellulales bacterium]
MRSFLIALAAVACVEVIRRFAMENLLGVSAPLMSFVVAVIVAAWFGGLATGLLATLLGAAAGVFVFVTSREVSSVPANFQVRILTFMVIGALISWCFESVRATRRRMEGRQQELEHEVRERRKAEDAERERRED